MMSDLYLLRNALIDALRPRRLAITALLVCLPAVVAAVRRATLPSESFDPTEAYDRLAGNMIFSLILTILSVVHGTGALSRDIEGRTIVYLLTRPIPRWRILLVKYLAAWITISVTACLSALLLGVVLFGSHAGAHVLVDLKVLPVGAAAYAALFILLVAVLPRQLIALLFSLLFAVGWENLIALMPGGFARLSVMAHLHTLASHLKESAETTGAANDPASQLMTFEPAVITPLQAWLALGFTTALALGVALIVFSNREYSPREEGG